MKLYNTKTNEPVKKDDQITDFRGERATVKGWTEPRHSGSTGRIDVRYEGTTGSQEFYPSVFNCEFREESK
jgi:hypothetical protein